jgi:hypothetical protein
MIALLLKLGLSEKAAKLVAYIAIPLLILAAFYLSLDAYGDSRYREGQSDADKAWQEASDRLIAKSQKAATKADTAAAARAADYAARVEEEKEKIDEAIAEGSSPLDVLFGAGR